MKTLSGFFILGMLSLAPILAVHGQDDPAIPTLFNTGVNDSYQTLSQGDIDPHYLLDGGPAYVWTDAGGYPAGVTWLGDDSLSTWIGPDDYEADAPIGLYYFTTTFDLTAADLSDVSIQGQLSEDDQLSGIYLNGNFVGQANGTGWAAWTPFSINASDAAGDFALGTNTLEFVVNNSGGGPMGLRVEYSAPPVPDSPLAIGLVAAVFAGLLAAAPSKRLRSQKSL